MPFRKPPLAPYVITQDYRNSREPLDTTPRAGDSVELLHEVQHEGEDVRVCLNNISEVGDGKYKGTVYGFEPIGNFRLQTIFAELEIDVTEVEFEKSDTYSISHGASIIE